MDVQAISGILKGANQFLAQQRIDVIYSEVFFVPMYQNQPLFGEICAELPTATASITHTTLRSTVNREGCLVPMLFSSHLTCLTRIKMLPGYNLDGTSKNSARQVSVNWTLVTSRDNGKTEQLFVPQVRWTRFIDDQ